MTVNFFRSIINENSVKTIICTYPGRFQPFGVHHYLVWMELCGVFGTDNVFITTSNSTDDAKNPLSYEDKKISMQKYGIKNIIEVSAPYRPIELMRNYDPDTTVLVVALGEKDEDRKLIRGKDGYYQAYNKTLPLNGFRKNGYVFTARHVPVSYKGREINGTLLREVLPVCSKEDFEYLMGWYDADIHVLFKKRFSTLKKRDTMTEIANEIKSDQTNKHLKHPWECMDLTYNDLESLISDSVLGRLNSVTEKIDGQNLMVTIRNRQVLFARNKSEIKNPVHRTEFLQKFNHLPFSVQSTFSDSTKFLETILSEGVDFYFKNSGSFLNLEILDPRNVNVIQYSPYPLIVLHSFIEFDDSGNELSRNIGLSEKLYSELKMKSDSYTILPPRKVVLNSLYNAQRKIEEFKSELSLIWNKYNLKSTDTLQTYYGIRSKEEPRKMTKDAMMAKYQYPFEILFSKLGFHVLSEIEYVLCKSPYSAISLIRKRIAKITTDVGNESDPLKIRKLQTELGKLNAIGGTDTILSIEGIVFTFNGKLMKYTGSFRFINQILGINRYSR
jgi:hypothetical protein